MDKNTTIAEMVDMLQSGEIAPGSLQGIEAIRQIASANPKTVATMLYAVNNDALEKGLKAAGFTEDAIDDLLKPDTPDDPFTKRAMGDPRPEVSEDEKSIYDYDPSLEMSRGPRPRGV